MRLLRWFGGARCLGEDVATGETMLVRGGIPGELVEVSERRVGRRRQVSVRKVLEADSRRIEASCVHAHTCAGCDLLHLSLADERSTKAQILSEIMGRFASVEIPAEAIKIIGTSQRGGHRNRARFRVTRTNQGLVIGFGAIEGGLVHVPDCPANSTAIRECAMMIGEAIAIRPPMNSAGLVRKLPIC